MKFSPTRDNKCTQIRMLEPLMVHAHYLCVISSWNVLSVRDAQNVLKYILVPLNRSSTSSDMWEVTSVWYKPDRNGFSRAAPLTKPDNSLLWGSLIHCRTFSGIVGLYPLDAGDSPPPTTVIKVKNVSRYYQSPPEDKISSGWEPISWLMSD